MRAFLAVAIGIGIGIVGCASPPNVDCHGHFAIGSDLTPFERDRAREAMARWNAFAGPETLAEAPESETCTVHMVTAQNLSERLSQAEDQVSDEDRARLASAKPGSFAFGDYSVRDGTIWLAPFTDANGSPRADSLLHLAMHELGHGLGMAHTADPSGVMVAFEGTTAFSEDDHEECERIGVCR